MKVVFGLGTEGGFILASGWSVNFSELAISVLLIAAVSVVPRFLSPATTVAERNTLLASVVPFTVDEDCVAVAINKSLGKLLRQTKVDKIIISNS